MGRDHSFFLDVFWKSQIRLLRRQGTAVIEFRSGTNTDAAGHSKRKSSDVTNSDLGDAQVTADVETKYTQDSVKAFFLLGKKQNQETKKI